MAKRDMIKVDGAYYDTARIEFTTETVCDVCQNQLPAESVVTMMLAISISGSPTVNTFAEVHAECAGARATSAVLDYILCARPS